jgi:putative transposon-encoded protein
MVRKIYLKNGEIKFSDQFETIIEKTVTKFGTGAKVDCPKEYLGRKVYLVIKPKTYG